MFRKFHERLKDHEEGFTLIELLVVILIIAILAAIAIPVFLNQRKKGWASQTESAVKNAATAQESFATGSGGLYTSSVASLETEGLRYNKANIAMAANGDANGYCIVAVYDTNGATAGGTEATTQRWYHSKDGRPVTSAPTLAAGETTCPTMPSTVS